MKSQSESPVHPCLERRRFLTADDYFCIGISPEVDNKFAVEIIGYILYAISTNDILTVGAKETVRVKLHFKRIH